MNKERNEKAEHFTSVVVKQVRSSIGRTKEVRDTLQCLGLGRIGKLRQVELKPAVIGMLQRVGHLVEVSTVN